MTTSEKLVAVAELEEFGLKVKNINLIEQQLGIIYIEDLLRYTSDQLKDQVRNFGKSGVKQLKKALRAAGIEFK